MIVFFSAQTFLEQAHKRWTLLEEQQSCLLGMTHWGILVIAVAGTIGGTETLLRLAELVY